MHFKIAVVFCAYQLSDWRKAETNRVIKMGYDDKLEIAAIEAQARIAEGVSFYTATEHYADAYNVSLCELQYLVSVRLSVAA